VFTQSFLYYQFIIGIIAAFCAGWFFDKLEVTDSGFDKFICYILSITAMGSLSFLGFDMAKNQPWITGFVITIGLVTIGLSLLWLGFQVRRLIKP